MSKPQTPSVVRKLEFARSGGQSTVSGSAGTEWMRPGTQTLRPCNFDVLSSSDPMVTPLDPNGGPTLTRENTAALNGDSGAAPTGAVEQPGSAGISQAQLEEAITEALDLARAEVADQRSALEAERAALVAERQRFAEAAQSLAVAEKTQLKSMEEPLLKMAVQIAEAILQESLNEAPEGHLKLAQTALDALDDVGGATLAVSGEGYQALVDALGGPSISHRGVGVELVLDPNLEGLGCVALSGSTRVDGRLNERLAAVREALLHERRSGGGAR